MADANLKISVTSDTSKAQSDLKGLDNQVGKTGDGIGTLGKAAAIGGAALVAIGVKSVLAFEDLGLTVGKFSDATGLSKEASSRLIEVSGDLGISSETVSSSIGKMSKQLGANADAFKAYGIEAVKGKDGQTDVNETFLHAVDVINQIQDPLKKAEASAKVFGKGYQQMSELLGESSDKIRKDLAAVDSQKIFDDKKVQSARDLRDAFDSIKDAGENLLLTIGSALAPVITKLAPTLTKVVQAAMPLAEAIGDVLGAALEAIGPIIEALLPILSLLAKALKLVADLIATGFDTHGFSKGILDANEKLKGLAEQAKAAGITTEQWKQMMADAAAQVKSTGDGTADFTARVDALEGSLNTLTGTVNNAQHSSEGYSTAVHDVQVATEDATIALDEHKRHAQSMADDLKRNLDEIQGKWDELSGSINSDQSLLNLQGQFDEVKTKATDAWDAAAKGADDTEQKVRDAHSATNALKLEVIDYGKEVLGLPPEKVTKMIADIDAGKLAEVEAALNNLARNRTMNLDIQAKSGAGFSNLPHFDKGGTVPGPMGAPTLAVVHGGERVIANGGGGNGAAGLNITNHFNGITDHREIARQQAREFGWVLRAS